MPLAISALVHITCYLETQTVHRFAALPAWLAPRSGPRRTPALQRGVPANSTGAVVGSRPNSR
jgi:hypothetical protein